MTELINFFPSLLLIAMVILTLALLPLLNEDRSQRGEERRGEHSGD